VLQVKGRRLEDFLYMVCLLLVRKEAVEKVLRILVCIPGKGSASAGDSLPRCRQGAFEF
jgi:hypothetical protein